jgi:hypothetical protein
MHNLPTHAPQPAHLGTTPYRMAASFGAGACFALASGLPNPAQSAISTGTMFAAFNGIFYQVRLGAPNVSHVHVGRAHNSDACSQLGKNFAPKQENLNYEKGKYMLTTLGLTVRAHPASHSCVSSPPTILSPQKFEKNLQRGQLTDETIMLWNDRCAPVHRPNDTQLYRPSTPPHNCRTHAHAACQPAMLAKCHLSLKARPRSTLDTPRRRLPQGPARGQDPPRPPPAHPPPLGPVPQPQQRAEASGPHPLLPRPAVVLLTAAGPCVNHRSRQRSPRAAAALGLGPA